MRTRSVLVLVVAVLGLAGCETHLMTTPAVIAQGELDPFEHVVPERRNNQVKVFVASARTVSGKASPTRFYTNDRSRELRLGVATVEIGPGMSWEELTRESLAAKRRRNPKMKVTAFEEFGPLWTTVWPPDIRFHPDWEAPGVDREPAEHWVEAIEAELESSRRRSIGIYVHGFNTKFDDNLTRSAEFLHYTSRDAVGISFDWPSKGSVFSYQVDKANARFAIRQFRRLLEFLAENTSAARINILAHSAGNPIAVEALRQLSLMHYDLDNEEAQRRTKIGRVIFAAPDMDLDNAFSAGVDGAARLAEGFIVYASRKDKALGYSGGIFGDVRVGRSIGKLAPDEVEALIANDTQWIDVTAAQKRSGTFLGHSYFHNNPWVSSDLMLCLAWGATAEERGLVRDMETGFLVFPDDYEEQLPEIAKRLQAKYDTE